MWPAAIAHRRASVGNTRCLHRVCGEMTPARVLTSRILSVVLLAVAFAIPAVSARVSASSGPQVGVTPTQGPPGTRVAAMGTGFCSTPCTAVEIDFSSLTVARNVAVAGDGTFFATFLVPGGAQPGPNQVYATQQTSQSPPQTLQARAQFDLTPSQPAPGSSATPLQRIPPPSASPSRGEPTTPAASVSSNPTSSTRSSTAASGLPAGGSSPGPPMLLIALIAAGGLAVLAIVAVLINRFYRST